MDIPDTEIQAEAGNESVMGVMEAIYKRRAIRSYRPLRVHEDDIKTLLAAAVQAPTALHSEPWAFAVIQDTGLLKEISDSAKKSIIPEVQQNLPDFFKKPDFNTFYNAETLVVIYARQTEPFVVADCWLAAENLMLAACAMGLGTCVIGLAVETLNSREWKQKLGVATDMTAYVPIILGVPDKEVPSVPRKDPEIIVWKK